MVDGHGHWNFLSSGDGGRAATVVRLVCGRVSRCTWLRTQRMRRGVLHRQNAQQPTNSPESAEDHVATACVVGVDVALRFMGEELRAANAATRTDGVREDLIRSKW